MTNYVTDSAAYALHRPYFSFNFKKVFIFILHPIQPSIGENDSLSSNPGSAFKTFNSHLIPKPESFLNKEFGFIFQAAGIQYCGFNENIKRSVPFFVCVLNEIKKYNNRVQLLGYEGDISLKNRCIRRFNIRIMHLSSIRILKHSYGKHSHSVEYSYKFL